MRKDQLLAGILSPLIALTGIGAAIAINRSWWRLTDNAISDLGRVGLQYNWVMNVPLLITALLAIYYATGLLKEFKNPVTRVGVGIFILGLVFLAGIALFPEGTEPHYWVSWGFFIAGSVGFLIAGIGLWMEGLGKFGLFTVLLFTAEVILAKWAFGAFSGVAIPEFIGVFAIAAWHYALIWSVFFPKRR
ncbi:DUF998 domain-containing protein [Thermococcus celer]|uniref:DUF998 domain-containing protein n=1 Tax=Thermococcus celer Vu 13 = JCM 8558 TaxID=1293037 RepID=A0A218P125_THECE|nr:DUF998 domain-containing protein [Thermococcus celer]ASI98628.1 hypothetical protein A3L02_03125 [Thermococcus celer Vu 13 = JCM 8558]